MKRDQRRRFLLVLLVGALVLAGVTIASRWSAILYSLHPAPAYTPQPLAPTCAPQSPAPTCAPQPLAPTCAPQALAPTCTPQPPAPTCAPQAMAPTYTPPPLAPTCAPQIASACGPQPLGCLVQYSDDGLGFMVQIPCGWEIARSQELQGIAGIRGGVLFRSNRYAHDSQVFGHYSVGVAVNKAEFGTLTDTVEYSLSRIVPEVRERIMQQCCFEVGGEPAMELTHMPGERWPSRVLVVLHDGWRYSFRFHPYEFGFDLPSDAAAWEAFDLFLRTFTFIPITPYPLEPQPPVPTEPISPLPTPPP